MPAPTVLAILAPGFEELEAVAPIDLLRRAGVEVTVASLEPAGPVKGRNGLSVAVDRGLDEALALDYDCVLLPGGPGVSQLRADPRVLSLVRRQSERGGWVAAICAAPVVLKDAGILAGRRFTAHSSVRGELPEALGGERAVADGRILTSRGAGTALDFALLLVEKLVSAEKAAEIAGAICA
jgi:4-methyl-5(b-hydroxyethyl)-thiazole monophosphate biosynthesis